jgi:hypothetical protein
MLMYDRETGEKRSTVWLIRPVLLIGKGWDDPEGMSEMYDQEILEDENNDSFADNDDEDSDLDDNEPPESEVEVAAPQKKPLKMTSMDDSFGFSIQKPSSPAVESSGSKSIKTEGALTSPRVTIEPASPGPSPLNEHDEGSPELPSVDFILCRICERPVPASLFEEHNTACSQVHKYEMEVRIVNDRLRDHRKECKSKSTVLESEVKREHDEMMSRHRQGMRRLSASEY